MSLGRSRDTKSTPDANPAREFAHEVAGAGNIGALFGDTHERNRVAFEFAQALLGMPKLLFLDEPTTGLDPLLRRDFYQIIGDLRKRGTTVLISSHALNEVEAQADRIAVIKQ